MRVIEMLIILSRMLIQSCGQPAPPLEGSVDSKEKAVAVLAAPDRVDAFRASGGSRLPPHVVYGPTPADPTTASAVAESVRMTLKYSPVSSACERSYAVQLRYHRGGDAIDLVICPRCGDFELIAPGYRTHGNLGPRARIASAALFPADVELAALLDKP